MYQVILHKTPDGKSLQLNNEHLAKFLQQIKTDRVLVTLDGMSRKPTASQRGYYFAAVVTAFAMDRGYSPDEVHEYLKLTCNPVQFVNRKTGEITIIAGSTTSMAKQAYAEYIDRCIMELAQQGFVVLTPDEYYESIAQVKK